MEEIEKKVLEEKPHDNVNKSNKKLNKKEKSKSVKRTRDKSDDKNSKRRKRIIERADSDSDGKVYISYSSFFFHLLL